jgi:hypothetical protein
MRRPHRSNQALSQDRATRAVKVIYWTEAKLQKLLRRIVKNDRQRWFAARVRALNSWPTRSKDEIMESASRINPRRLMDGKWSWPKSVLAIEREQVPPKDSIDIDALRDVLDELDNRQGDRLIEMIAESVSLEAVPVRLESGIAPREIGTPLLRRIKRRHNMLLRDLDGDPDGDLVRARRLEVPRANPRSSPGWLDIRSAFKLRGKYRGE